MDPLRASCAVVLADDHAGAAGKAQKAADEHIDDGAHRTYSGEGLVGDKIAHHPCIHHVVQLLKEVADHERQGKVDDQTRDIAHNNTVNRVIKLLEQVAYKEGKGERDQEFGDIAFGHIHAGVGRMRVLDMVHSLAFLYMIFV